MATRLPAAKNNSVKATAAPTRRGRPPRKVYINVLVKATTRDGLAKLKSSGSLASQGEVIDELVERVLSVKTRNGTLDAVAQATERGNANNRRSTSRTKLHTKRLRPNQAVSRRKAAMSDNAICGCSC